MRKVPYRMAGTKRVFWGVILAQREGISLLFVQSPDDNKSHMLAMAAENVAERVFEDVNLSRFSVEYDDLAEIAGKMEALGEVLSQGEFHRFFLPDDIW